MPGARWRTYSGSATRTTSHRKRHSWWSRPAERSRYRQHAPDRVQPRVRLRCDIANGDVGQCSRNAARGRTAMQELSASRVSDYHTTGESREPGASTKAADDGVEHRVGSDTRQGIGAAGQLTSALSTGQARLWLLDQLHPSVLLTTFRRGVRRCGYRLAHALRGQTCRADANGRGQIRPHGLCALLR